MLLTLTETESVVRGGMEKSRKFTNLTTSGNLGEVLKICEGIICNKLIYLKNFMIYEFIID